MKRPLKLGYVVVLNGSDNGPMLTVISYQPKKEDFDSLYTCGWFDKNNEFHVDTFPESALTEVFGLNDEEENG